MIYFLFKNDTKISPILLYGPEICGVDIHKEIEMIQMFACKHFLCVNSLSSNHVVRGERVYSHINGLL